MGAKLTSAASQASARRMTCDQTHSIADLLLDSGSTMNSSGLGRQALCAQISQQVQEDRAGHETKLQASQPQYSELLGRLCSSACPPECTTALGDAWPAATVSFDHAIVSWRLRLMQHVGRDGASFFCM